MAPDRNGLTRRSFLFGVGGAVALGACGGVTRSDRSAAGGGTTTTVAVPAVPPAPDGLTRDPFTLGVASGDPLPDGIVLWTRLAPDPLAGGGMPDAGVPILWELALDPSFERVVDAGLVTTSADTAHTAHVDVRGLTPDTAHHYRFRVGAFTSPAGRTRTLPAPDAPVERLVFTASACQDDQAGFRTPYAHLVEEDDAAFNLWLGDYVYESRDDPTRFRPNGLTEAVDLASYRHRYALYRLDPGLQAAHAAMAWLTIWDDHEVVNNYTGPFDQLGTDTATFLQRRADAYRAWWEHQPVRLDPPTGPDLAIHQVVDVGDLVRFTLLDTRQYRDDQPCGARLFLNLPCGEELDPERTMLGQEQLGFVTDALARTPARWNVVVQGLLMTPLPIAMDGQLRLGLDAWDGYQAERATLLGLLADTPNPIVLSADFHAGVVADLPEGGRLGGRPVATEFGTGSISSGFPQDFVEIVEAGAAQLDHVRHFDNRQRGYLRCEVTPDEWRTEFRVVETTFLARSDLAPGTSWVVPAGGVVAHPA